VGGGRLRDIATRDGDDGARDMASVAARARCATCKVREIARREIGRTRRGRERRRRDDVLDIGLDTARVRTRDARAFRERTTDERAERSSRRL